MQFFNIRLLYRLWKFLQISFFFQNCLQNNYILQCQQIYWIYKNKDSYKQNMLLVWKTTVMLILSFIDFRTICYSCITFLSLYEFLIMLNKLWLFCQNLSLFTCYISIVLYLYVCLTGRQRRSSVAMHSNCKGGVDLPTNRLIIHLTSFHYHRPFNMGWYQVLLPTGTWNGNWYLLISGCCIWYSWKMFRFKEKVPLVNREVLVHIENYWMPSYHGSFGYIQLV
jgi:hypothetical protein